MNPNAMINELASALKDVIRDTDEGYLKMDPEDAYTDLASRLVLRLSVGALTIVPVKPSAEARRDEIARKHCESAARIFDILTGWLNGHEERSFSTGYTPRGKFEVMVRGEGVAALRALAYFQGDTVQDVYAQAAQTISFNGESHDEEIAQRG